MNAMDVGSRAKLRTFNGNMEAPEGCDPSENYWSLIGSIGTVVKPENGRSRILFQFDKQVSELELHCHNEVPNSLLISVSDLEPI
ncbi:MAG: hypothetical protein V3U60_13180 [Gammaproteobacteria bacterium]|jgi:hypothetical protein